MLVQRNGLGLLVLVIMVLLSVGAAAQPLDDGPRERVDVYANEYQHTTEGGEEIDRLIGSVRVQQGRVLITSNEAIYRKGTEDLVFSGNVHIYQLGAEILSDRVEYSGINKIAVARNGVTLRDSGAVLTAGSGQYDMKDRTAYFENGVTLRDSGVVLRANSGYYDSRDLKAIFKGNVSVENQSGVMYSNELTYWRPTRESFATGSVRVIWPERSAQIEGDTLRDKPEQKYTLVLGSARLTRVDTVGGGDGVRYDTTTVLSRQVEAFGKNYVATDSVRVIRPDLQAVAAVATFIPDSGVIGLASDRRVASGSVESGNMVYEHRPVIWYGTERLTQLVSDTMTVKLQERRLNTIDAVGRAFLATEGVLPGRYDQLYGDRVVIGVVSDTIRQIRSEGSASSVLFLYENGVPIGVNRVSGASIRIAFDGGEVSAVRVVGGKVRTEGDVTPEHMVRGNEKALRLQGFEWHDRTMYVRQ